MKGVSLFQTGEVYEDSHGEPRLNLKFRIQKAGYYVCERITSQNPYAFSGYGHHLVDNREHTGIYTKVLRAFLTTSFIHRVPIKFPLL